MDNKDASIRHDIRHLSASLSSWSAKVRKGFAAYKKKREAFEKTNTYTPIESSEAQIELEKAYKAWQSANLEIETRVALRKLKGKIDELNHKRRYHESFLFR